MRHVSCSADCTAGPGPAEQSSVQPPYDGQTEDADVFIDMPNLRQYGGYTCGTTCVQMVMNWLDPYQADLGNLAAYEEELGTNEEAGTPPGSIVSFFEENSVTVTAKENRTTRDVLSPVSVNCAALHSGMGRGRGWLQHPKSPIMRTPIGRGALGHLCRLPRCCR